MTERERRKKPLIAVVGTTACGKSELAVHLCERFDGEIVSADSMQIYRGMDIGTAKPSEALLERVKHHMVGVVGVDTPFSVAQYCDMALACLADICARGKIPFVVGGTGLYVDSLTDGIRFHGAKTQPELRARLQELLDEKGAQALLEMLREKDPEAAALLHQNNTGRIIRALEINIGLSMTKRRYNELSKTAPPPYDALRLGLFFRDREQLYERINRRVDEMMDRGLLEEARALYRCDSTPTAGQAIGYKELHEYFEGRIPLDEAVELIKRRTRQYAKRQMTWFSKHPSTTVIHVDDYEDIRQLSERAAEIVNEFLSRRDER